MLLLIFFLLFPGLSLSERCHPDDKAALLKFKHSFSNPNPLPSITPEGDCCDVVQCDEATNHVVELSIAGGSDLEGNIPDAVGDLTYLKTLRLHKMPFLIGEIPRSIAKLKHLTFLDISWTNVSGPVPHFLSELESLMILDLSFNKLSGSIPPSIATLPNLFGLDLSRNKLTGPIPESFAHFPITSNLQITLSHNMLSGQIPKSLASKKFSRVDILRNNFVGDASMFFGKSNGAENVLDISRNNFEFNLSSVTFSEELDILDISHNKIYGSISSQITEAVFLQSFNVSYNRLCGKIPTGWKLRYRSEIFDNSSYIHNCCLCGPPLDNCKP